MDSKELAKDSYAKAMRYMSSNKSRAFAHYLVALTLCPEWRPQMLENFVQLTENVGETLLKSGRVDDFYKCYEHALELYPNSAELKRYFAKHLLSINLPHVAFSFYREATLISPEIPLWQRELDDLKNMLVSRWHYRMLNDRVRNEAYRSAILSTIGVNDSVADIGSGSGLLTLFAAETKPKRLIAIESNVALYNIALGVFSENNLNNVLLLNSLSTSLDADKIMGRVSAVVTETFDVGFFGEGVLQTMIHARKSLMLNQPTDVIIPKSGSLYVCGINSEKLAKKHMFLDNNLKDRIKFYGVKVFADNSQDPYDSEDLNLFADLTYVTDVQKFLHVDFYDTQFLEDLLSGKVKIDVKLMANCDTKIHAYAVWFDLNLTDKISISNDPRETSRANAWEQAIFYLDSSLIVKRNEKINVDLTCENGKLQLFKNSNEEDYFPVSTSVVHILNDSVLINSSDSAASSACVHLTQVCSLKEIRILDLSPFPITGFLLLARGIQYLTCLASTEKEQRLILRLCELNSISADRITFETESDILKNDKKYHLIVNNFINEAYGELNIKHILRAKDLARRKLEKNGVTMPYEIKLMAKLIYSEELERVNRVHNQNVAGYKIEEFMNQYTVGLNFNSDITSLPHVGMSENIELLGHCVKKCGYNVRDLELVCDGKINGVVCWFEVQTMENGDFYSTNVEGSWSVCSIHILEKGLVGTKGQKASVLMCYDEDGYLRIAVDLE